MFERKREHRMSSKNHEDVLPKVRPAEPPWTGEFPEPPPFPSAADSRVIRLLMDARERARLVTPECAQPHEAEIASLECELAGRGYTLPEAEAEPMPPVLALPVLIRALRNRDAQGADRALNCAPFHLLWLAWQRIRECDDRDLRIRCLQLLLERLDRAMLGDHHASTRLRVVHGAGLEPHDLEALLEQCISSMFAAALSRPSTGGAR